MITVERNATVDAPADRVWSALGDFGGIAAWADNVDHSWVVTQPNDGVGAVRRIQTGRTTLLETAQVWERNEVLSYSISGLPPVIRRVTNTWRLVAVGERTEVTLTTEVDAGPRPPHQLIAKIVGRKLGQASDVMLAGLADHVTQEQQGAAS